MVTQRIGLLTLVSSIFTLKTMIKSFAHKGLELFFLLEELKGIQFKNQAKLRIILDWLDDATCPNDVNFPGSMLHPLKGDLQGYWSVKVSGNWRITFRFEDGNAYVVDYQDYH